MSDPSKIILTAIRVLRSRRVRPSAAKIAWYARREFLQSEETTHKALQELERAGDILKVIYKGGTSYRVASQKDLKSVNRVMIPTAKKLPTSLDVLRPLLCAISGCGSCATKDRIADQLIASKREDLVEKLDTLLQKEVRVGVIGKKTVFIGGRTVPAYFITRSAPLLASINKSYKSTTPQVPKKGSGSPRHTVVHEGSLSRKTPTPFEHLQQQIKKLQREKETKDSDDSSPEGSGRSKDASSASDKSPTDESSQETEYQRLLEETPVTASPEKPLSRRGRPRKPPVLYEDVTGIASTSRRGRPPKIASSSRGRIIKRARKVFDPSNETSTRKKTLSSTALPEPQPPPPPPPPPPPSNVSGNCDSCCQPGSTNEPLLVCHRCPSRAHPSCLGYSTQLAERSRRKPWTCMDCKLCEICYFDHTIGTLIFCDACDRAFHLTCHQPALDEYPQGSWVCFLCCPNDGFNVYEYLQHGLPTPRDSPVLDEESLGSGGSWDHKSYDPNIPNASTWTIDQVVDYFNERGYEEYSDAFKEHEVDGTALMMLTRNDVLTGLGLLLGPALHIYKEIRILQTRNPDPQLP